MQGRAEIVQHMLGDFLERALLGVHQHIGLFVGRLACGEDDAPVEGCPAGNTRKLELLV